MFALLFYLFLQCDIPELLMSHFPGDEMLFTSQETPARVARKAGASCYRCESKLRVVFLPTKTCPTFTRYLPGDTTIFSIVGVFCERRWSELPETCVQVVYCVFY